MHISVKRNDGQGERIVNTDSIVEVHTVDAEHGGPEVYARTTARTSEGGPYTIRLEGEEARQFMAAYSPYRPALEPGE